MLAERDGEGDRDRALAMLEEAIVAAAELGMAAIEREARELGQRLIGPVGLSGDASLPGRRTVTRRDRARAKVTARGRAAVARWTRGDPDDDLIRRFAPNLAQRTLFSAMTRSFQPAMAMGFTGDLVFELRPPEDELDPAAADWWTIEIRGRKATAHRGRGDQPSVTIHVGLADFVRLASGELHPVRALIENTITVEGDVMIAARLPDMFGAVEPLEGLARSGTFS
jgi:hypothetical protein